MFKKLGLFYLVFVSFTAARDPRVHGFDCALVGSVNIADGIGRHPFIFEDAFKKAGLFDDENFLLCQVPTFTITLPAQKMNHAITIYNPVDVAHTKVSILTDIVFDKIFGFWERDHFNLMPKSDIRLAFSVFEANEIPKYWPALFNNYFDAVLVCDEYFINVYKECGVTIPIFLLPQAALVDDLLEQPYKTKKNEEVFLFGSLGSYDPRKNYEALIRAFAQVFGGNDKVALRINGRPFGIDGAEFKRLQKIVQGYGFKNIHLTCEKLPWSKYGDLLRSFDCYVNTSYGEGFSIPPREALSVGLPCIIANNTAQGTLCKTGFVRAVECSGSIDAYYGTNFRECIGKFFVIDHELLKKALLDVYTNYTTYLEKASRGRAWVRDTATTTALAPLYKTVVRPDAVVLGDRDVIEPGMVITTSPALYAKYAKLIAENAVDKMR